MATCPESRVVWPKTNLWYSEDAYKVGISKKSVTCGDVAIQKKVRVLQLLPQWKTEVKVLAGSIEQNWQKKL